MRQLNQGSKAVLTIPADKAYGKRGVPGKIPADAALGFEIEVVRVMTN